MPFLICCLCLVFVVWGAVLLWHGSIFTSAAIFLIATSAMPAEFFSLDAFGLTWTLDRFWFLVLLTQFALNWYRGELYHFRLEVADIAIGLFFVWLLARTLTQPLGSVIKEQPPTLMHLINGYVIPFSLYAMLRFSCLKKELMPAAVVSLVAFGVYLGVTAVFEKYEMWALVFPRFIADPELGIHFGRARGPMLQSVRLGICLLASLVTSLLYLVWLHPQTKPRLLLGLIGTGSTVIGVALTLTRSVWLGLVWVVMVLVVSCLEGLPRRATIFGLLTVGMLGLAFKGPDLVAFKREYSAAETRESTYMRAAFAYVSWQMFKDRPIAGYGFNQFQIYNRPYLADRSTGIRLESIRGYVHHNSYLSLLVDLGIVGFALYAFVLQNFGINTWIVLKGQGLPQWVRGIAIAAACVGGVHAIQMLFHEVSFIALENGYLFAAFGLVVAAKQQFCTRPDAPRQLLPPKRSKAA